MGKRKDIEGSGKEALVSLATIKILLENYFKKLGREEFGDIDMLRNELIDKIAIVSEKVKIPKKYMIIASLELSEKQNDEKV